MAGATVNLPAVGRKVVPACASADWYLLPMLWLIGVLTALAPAAAPARATVSSVEADVETVMTDSSTLYLRARARLEARPDRSAPVLLERLRAVPAPSPAQRRRLLSVLGQMRRPEDLQLFAGELRRAVVHAPAQAELASILNPWRALLLDQGGAAIPQLQALVGDRALPLRARILLLHDLVGAQPAPDTGALVAWIGRGDPELERALRRALAQRARADATVHRAVASATDAALDRALLTPPLPQETARIPALLRFRAQVAGDDAPAVALRLGAVAEDERAPFTLRVAAVRALGTVRDDHADAVLRRLARRQLGTERRTTQRGELLGWLALGSLRDARKAQIARELALREDPAPRLAVLGYRFAARDDGHPWLAAAIENPWPQVRQAAFERVHAPCSEADVRILGRRVRSTEEGRNRDRAAARAAVAALGRCSTPKAMRALRALLRDARADLELRAEAARRLCKHGGTRGSAEVVRQLRSDPEPILARRLAAALRHAPAATPAINAALCDAARTPSPVARAAADSLRALHEGEGNPCDP